MDPNELADPEFRQLSRLFRWVWLHYATDAPPRKQAQLEDPLCSFFGSCGDGIRALRRPTITMRKSNNFDMTAAPMQVDIHHC